MATHFFHSVAAPVAVPNAEPDKRYLFSPAIDFLCLGGSSLIILPLLLLVPVADHQAQLGAVMLLVAHLVNHPHFAHSYQIFYRGFRTKAFTADLGRNMQLRYIVSGLVVPIALTGFFAYCLMTGDAQLMGYGGNAMALFVGWHYVKQGYGMLMVDAALKRQYFTAPEKKALLVNCYAVWITSWLGFNDYVSEQQLWGLHYFTFDLPDPIVVAAAAVALATGATAGWMLLSRWRSTRRLPLNGVVAYAVSLYVWLLFVGINPLWGLVVPALHSIQYMVVVWRFQTNYQKSRRASDYQANSMVRQVFGSNPLGHLAVFALSAVLLGYIGFWGLPLLLTAVVPHDEIVFGSSLFLFVGWIFINVHHYFLDTVMWRRENPDTKRFLFG